MSLVCARLSRRRNLVAQLPTKAWPTNEAALPLAGRIGWYSNCGSRRHDPSYDDAILGIHKAAGWTMI